jgi:hypothetical protein
VIEKQRRFFNAWGCFAESRFPGRARDVSRETFLRKKDCPPIARGRDVSRETVFSADSHPFTAPISSPRVM